MPWYTNAKLRQAALGAMLTAGLCGCVQREVVVERQGPPPPPPPADAVIVDQQPPPPAYEPPTVAPGPEFIWVNGYWVWGGRAYIWHRGGWTRRPYRGAVWVEGRWSHGPRGWYRVGGGWH